MFGKKEMISVSIQIQVLTFTKIEPGEYAIEFKRRNQTGRTESHKATEQLGIAYDKAFHIKCNFVLIKRKEWKRKSLEIYVIHISPINKTNSVICKWETDLSELYRKDAMELVYEAKSDLLGDIKLHFGLYRGEPPNRAMATIPPSSISNMVVPLKEREPVKHSRAPSFPFNMSTQTIAAHRRSVSNISTQQTSELLTLLGPTESIQEVCALISEKYNKKLGIINDHPDVAERIVHILWADTAKQIDRSKAIQQILYSLIKFNTGTLEEKIYACLVTLYIYIATKNSNTFIKEEASNLYDSFTQTFDFAVLDLVTEYGQKINDGFFADVCNQIKKRIIYLGTGRFYSHVMIGIEFAFATSFNRVSAETICANLGVNDPSLLNHLKSYNNNEQNIILDESPFVEQVTDYLTCFRI